MNTDKRREMREKAQANVAAFRSELECKNGMENHPKRDILWRLAWDYGHSSGFGEVEIHYDQLLELLQ